MSHGLTGQKICRAFYFLAPASLLVFLFQITHAATQIGAESTLALPTSAHYSSVVNVRPGYGEVVSNNPPIFSWFYATNHLMGGEQNPNGFWPFWSDQTNAFQFQISSNSTFTGNLQADVRTPMNFYNFLGPLDTNATRRFWWRVKYITNEITYATSPTYTFTVAASATNWDRSMFTNANYLATNAVHPMFCFRSGEEKAIWTWIQTQGREFTTLIDRAAFATNASYFKDGAEWPVNIGNINPTFASVRPADAGGRINDLGAALLLWAISGDNRWTNASMTGWLVTNLSHYANWYNHPSNNWAMADYANPAGSIEMPRLLCATYDWMYGFLGSDTSTFNGRLRTNVLLCLQRTLRFWTHNSFWSDSPYPTGGLILKYGWSGYPTRTEVSSWDNLTKIGTSHKAMDTHAALIAAVVLQQDGADGAFAFDWFFNYMLARTSPYAGFAAHHVGPYGYVDNHTYPRLLFSALMVMDVAYPQAQLHRTEFCRRFPDWWTRLNPYRMRKYHGPYGDGSTASRGSHSGWLGSKERGFDLAAVSRSGLAIQAFNLNAEFYAPENESNWDKLPLRYHYRETPAPETNTTSAVYPEDGYVIASQKSPSEFDCYTNGVGFSIRASPRGSSQGHNIHANLAPDMWAYGTQLTDGGGAGLDVYGYTAAASPGLFVNGYGEGDYGFSDYGLSQTVPALASICNFTNSGTDFVYCAADGTGLFTNSYHPLRTLVKKVKRHVLFVRSQYWVVYDEFVTASPATFAFRWHIPWAFRYDINDRTLGTKERVFSGHRIGSNSLEMISGGFTYTAGNYADAGYQNPPRVPVYVQFANASGSYGIFRAEGVNDLGISKTGVMGTSSANNSTLNPFLNRIYATVDPDRAVGMWVTNVTASTNWQLLTVIVPQKPGVVDPPRFQRFPGQESTIVVTYDGVTETNTFGNSYPGPATYRVDVKDGPNSVRGVGGLRVPGEQGNWSVTRN